MTLASNALTTVAEAKKFLSIPQADTSLDSVIEAYINASSQQIETFCKRNFGENEYTETIDGTGTEYISTKNYPITDIDEVNLDDVEVTDFEQDADKGMLYLESGWTKGSRNVEVTYTAGYILPKDATQQKAQTLPYDIEIACIFVVKAYLNDTMSKESERIGDYSVTYAGGKVNPTQITLPYAAQMMITPYRGRLI